MTTDLDQCLSVAVAVARDAGALLREGFFDKKEIRRKSSAIDLLTQFDEAAEAIIVPRLAAAFPGHTIVSEEGAGQAGSAQIWYVDPLDGTNNFAHAIPHFCVSVALVENGVVQVGVVYDPLRDECFHARRGGGAWLTYGTERRRLQVSAAEVMTDAIVGTGYPYDRHTNADNNVVETAAVLGAAQGLRRMGSAALDLAYVAAGRFDAYWEKRLNVWDMAAGILLVEEAGGLVTAPSGEPLQLAGQPDLLAGPAAIHTRMLTLLKR